MMVSATESRCVALYAVAISIISHSWLSKSFFLFASSFVAEAACSAAGLRQEASGTGLPWGESKGPRFTCSSSLSCSRVSSLLLQADDRITQTTSPTLWRSAAAAAARSRASSAAGKSDSSHTSGAVFATCADDATARDTAVGTAAPCRA